MTRKPSDLGSAAGRVGGIPRKPVSNRPAAKPKNRAESLRQIQSLIEANQLSQAQQETRALVSKNKRDAEAHFLLAVIAERAHDPASARSHATQSLSIDKNPGAFMIVSRVERQQGNTDDALEAIDNALALSPGNQPLLIQRASVLEEAGRYSEARGVIDPLIEAFESDSKPVPPDLRNELAKLLVQEKDYGRAVHVIDELLGEKSTPQQLAITLNYLKAKALDRDGGYAASFEAAGIANELGRVEYDPELHEQQVTALIEIWSAENMAKFPLAACTDELPVFIAGMPRSGTSLIDQIIDAHPKAAGVGEMNTIEGFARKLSQAYDPTKQPPKCFGSLGQHKWTRVAQDYVKEIRSLAPDGSQRVVNKALGNNKLVGLLARLFPKTRIIHSVRDPRDVAISCYMGGFNNRLHAWTTQIDWVANSWAQSERMMNHWRDTLDIPMLDVRYEELVRDPGTQFPRLIEFLGLEWDDACERFYESKRTVRTLSYDQVNRPLYTVSAGRHEHYAEQIRGVEFPAYRETAD